VLLQNTEVKKLENICLLDLMKELIESESKTINVHMKKWEKDFIIIGSPICEERYIFLFIDNSQNRKYQIKEISQKIVTLLYQSLTHKFMTPINSLKSVLYIVN